MEPSSCPTWDALHLLKFLTNSKVWRMYRKFLFVQKTACNLSVNILQGLCVMPNVTWIVADSSDRNLQYSIRTKTERSVHILLAILISPFVNFLPFRYFHQCFRLSVMKNRILLITELEDRAELLLCR